MFTRWLQRVPAPGGIIGDSSIALTHTAGEPWDSLRDTQLELLTVGHHQPAGSLSCERDRIAVSSVAAPASSTAYLQVPDLKKLRFARLTVSVWLPGTPIQCSAHKHPFESDHEGTGILSPRTSLLGRSGDLLHDLAIFFRRTSA